MSGHRLKQIAAALVVLILLWGAVEIFRGGYDEPTSDFRLPAVTADEADTVVFEHAADTVVLAKGPAGWTVNGNRAAPSGVDDFFATLADAPAGELAAQSAETHARLEIDNGAARVVRIMAGGDTLADLLVGKRAPGYQDTYFRRPGGDSVYAVRTRLATYVDRRVEDWRDKAIAEIAADSVQAADIAVGGEAYTLRRDGDTWVMGDGAAPDSGTVVRLLDQYKLLNAIAFVGPDDEPPDFDPPDRTAVLRNAAGDTLLGLAFDSTSGGFWVRRTGDTTVYQLSTYVVNRLAPRDSTVRKH
jgi:hypothetical protein